MAHLGAAASFHFIWFSELNKYHAQEDWSEILQYHAMINLLLYSQQYTIGSIPSNVGSFFPFFSNRKQNTIV